MKITSLHIAGRRWLQRSYGNTYHACTIYVNGETLETGKHYGYGDSFIYTAGQTLTARGYDIEDAILDTRNLREKLHGTYSVADVARERDL